MILCVGTRAERLARGLVDAGLPVEQVGTAQDLDAFVGAEVVLLSEPPSPGAWLSQPLSQGATVAVATLSSDETLQALSAGAHDAISVDTRAPELIARIGRWTECAQLRRKHLDLEARAAQLEDEVLSLRTERERLADFAFHDELTGLANRRAFQWQMDYALNYAARHGSVVTALMGDLDDFKHINDDCGHPVGDMVLRLVGGLVRRAVRVVDIPARVGGDEFAVLLPATSLADGAKVAQRIRKRVEEARLDGSPTFTVSIGLATVDLAQNNTAAEREGLLTRADLALYEAKRGGKNRIAFAPQTANA